MGIKLEHKKLAVKVSSHQSSIKQGLGVNNGDNDGYLTSLLSIKSS